MGCLTARQRIGRPRLQRGVTLVELLIVLVVTGILLGLATPNLSGVLQRNQLLGQANEIAAALSLARSEAISRGQPAGICGSTDGATCAAGGATDWSALSVLVFVDGNNNGSFDGDGQPAATPDRLLRSLNVIDGLRVTSNSSFYLFQPSGFGGQNAALQVTLTHDDNDAPETRVVGVAPSGIVAVTKPAEPSGSGT